MYIIVSTGTIYNDVNDPSLTEILVAHTNGIACYNRDQPGLILFPQLENLVFSFPFKTV